MQPTLFHELLSSQLRALDSHVRVIIIHPNLRQKVLALSTLLAQSGAAYLCLVGHRLTVRELDEQLERVLHEQDTPMLLVLDEVDRAEGAALEVFLETLLARLPDIRVALISRVLPFNLLQEARLRAQVRCIPQDPELLLWEYAERQERPLLLEVRAFGAGRVLLNGQPVNSWDGMLPRALFFYLVDRGMTTRADVFATFWPNLTVREATNVFHVTKRKISEVLGIDLTTYWSGFYRISPDIELSYDAAGFSELVQNSAIAEPAQAVHYLTRAVELYRGDFLTTLNSPWVHNRRKQLLAEYCDALLALGKAKEHGGDSATALGLYLRAFAKAHSREDLARSAMHIYDQMGYYADALTVYDVMAEALWAEMQILPAEHVQVLAQSIRQKRA